MDHQYVLGALDAISLGWEKIKPFLDDDELADEVISLARYGPEAAKSVLYEQAKSEDPIKRAIGVNAISGFPEIEPENLLGFLNDESSLVRTIAAINTALGNLENTPKPFVDELIKSLDNYAEVEMVYDQIVPSDSDLR